MATIIFPAELQEAPGLQAKTLLSWLQMKYPGKFDDSQLRSFRPL